MKNGKSLNLFAQTLIVVSSLACIVSCDSRKREPANGKRQSAQSKPAGGSQATPVANPSHAPAQQEIAGEIFSVPVSLSNYRFAKLVANIFARPWGGADLPEEAREAFIWEQLILHYTSFERGVVVSDQELDDTVNQLLKDQKQTFTRKDSPEAYAKWAKDTLNEDIELLENQMRYLIQIRKLKDQVREEQTVTVTEDDMKQEFLNEKNHVGGEAVMFDAKTEADDFYAKYKKPAEWEKMKAAGQFKVRPISTMTLEAYMDLWGVPKDQMYAFHAMELGSVGSPMPFGTKQWAVYRLLDKKTGDLADFPKERQSYENQLQIKKKYDGLQKWIEQRKADAKLKVFVKPENPVAVERPASTQGTPSQ